MHRSLLSVAALAATSMGTGFDVEVIPRDLTAGAPPSLGEWLTRNNRRRQTDGAFGAPKTKQRRQRLQRATGPGSYDEWKAAVAAERALKRARRGAA